MPSLLPSRFNLDEFIEEGFITPEHIVIGENEFAYPFFKVDVRKYVEISYLADIGSEPSADELERLVDELTSSYRERTMSYAQNNEVFAIVDENGDVFVTTLPTEIKNGPDYGFDVQIAIMKNLRESGYSESSFEIPFSQNFSTEFDSQGILTRRLIQALVDKIYKETK